MCGSKHKLLACVVESQHWSLRSHSLPAARQLTLASSQLATGSTAARLFRTVYSRAFVWELVCDCGPSFLFFSEQFAAGSRTVSAHKATRKSVNHGESTG